MLSRKEADTFGADLVESYALMTPREIRRVLLAALRHCPPKPLTDLEIIACFPINGDVVNLTSVAYDAGCGRDRVRSVCKTLGAVEVARGHYQIKV